MSTAYVVKLAPGVFIDSAGEVHTEAPAAAAVYEPPFQLPVDPAKVRDALKEVKDAIKDLPKNPSLLLTLHVWGLPPERKKALLELLKMVSEVADTLSKVAIGVAIGVQVLKLFGFLKDGPSALEVLVQERLKQLSAEVRAIGDIVTQHRLSDARLALDSLSSSIKAFAGQAPQLTHETYLAQYNLTAGALNGFIVDVKKPLQEATWMTLVDPNELQIWGSMSDTLHTLPAGTLDGKRRSSPPGPGDKFFDHRLMVPMALLTAQRYLVAVKTLSPEYRSTGDYRGEIRSIGKHLERMADMLRTFAIARTVHEPRHFQHVYATEVEAAPLGLGTPVIAASCTRWTVGALDVLAHNKTFFSPHLTKLQSEIMVGDPTETRFAGLDFAWKPPAILVDDNEYGYLITNPQECADAANAQAETAYAALLAASGYAELLRLSALFKHEASEPLQSQTVEHAEPLMMLQRMGEGAVEVQSNFLLGLTPVKANGRHETRTCSASLRIRTQPIQRAVPVRYRIVVRTLKEFAPYTDYCRTSYKTERDADGVLQLQTDFSDIEVGIAPLVNNWTMSPRERLVKEVPVHLMADTCNWFVPVSDAFLATGGQVPSLQELHAYGMARHIKAQAPAKPPRFGRPLPKGPDSNQPITEYPWVRDPLPGLSWHPVVVDDDRSARHIQRQEVRLQCVLDWHEDDLTISLQSEPEARSLVAHVVVEEQLTGSGQVLHTAIAVPLDGLVTYVPHSFFEQESQAIAKAGKAFADNLAVLLPDFGDIQPPGPGELTVVNPRVLAGALDGIARKKPELHQQLMLAVRNSQNG